MPSPSASSPILIVGPSWVGDMVMAGSLVAELKRRYPDRPVDVIAPAAAAPIASLIPGVRRALPLRFAHGEFGLIGRWRIGRSLRKEGYGTAIVLPRAFKAAVLPFAARIPERIAYAAEGRSVFLTDARPDGDRKTARTIDRFVQLGAPRGAKSRSERPILSVPIEAREAAEAKFPRPAGRPILGLCPGAEYGPAKRWPAEKFAALARSAHEAGFHIRLFGGPKDVPIAAEIAERASVPVEDVTGRTSLVEAAALLAACDAVVSNDSGLMHVAGALDRPLVVVYGASSETMTPPTGPNSAVVALDLSCRPCHKRECPLGTLACLEGIAPETVFAAVRKVLAAA